MNEAPRREKDPFAPAEVLGSGTEVLMAGPNYFLWLVDLFLRPKRFFETFIQDHLWPLTAIAAWVFGMASAAERAERQISSGRAAWLGQSWGVYLGFVAGVGVISAIIYYALGGWWYRVRLRWSGVPDAEPYLARRVYVYASLVYALPLCMVTLWQAMTFPRPIDAIHGSFGWTPIILLVLPLLWSVVTSYVGVRTVFGVRGFRGALWFLILPLLMYFGIFVGAGALYFFNGALMNPAPAVSQPAPCRSGDVAFSLPGNWGIDTADPDFSPGEYIPISMEQGAFCSLTVYEGEGTPAEEAEGSIDAICAESGIEPPQAKTFDRIGGLSGEGREVQIRIDGEEYIVRVFVTPWNEGSVLEMRRVVHVDDRQKLEPGFELIERSLRREAAVGE